MPPGRGEKLRGATEIVARDLSEDKRRDAESVQAEKMAAVSKLALGVAHDINNRLAVILGYCEYLRGRSMNLDDTDRTVLEAIQKQAQECAEKVRRIQLVARPVPKPTFTPCSVNEVVRDAIEFTEPLWRECGGEGRAGIQVETDLQPAPPLNAHRASLQEALVNLIMNAVAAVSDGGKVAIRTWSKGEEVVVEVADDGQGIEPDNIRRIFDPLVTTRGPASSGLGLSIAHNLIAQQGGTLSVESKVGVGTTVRVCMPSPRDREAEPSKAGEPGREPGQVKALKVLVVDDEPMVAGMLRMLLESAGHRATTYMGGAEAVDAFQNGEFDLAIVDLTMPRMDGWEVARRINRLSPQTPIIVATGWNLTVEDGREQGAVVKAVLKKPFTIGELTGAIHDAVDGSRNGPSPL